MEDASKINLGSSVLELSREALVSNLDFLRKRAGTGVTFSSVIKGNAYGHGIETFLPLAESGGVNHFSVFSADEAARALNARTNPDTRIMIMGMIDDDAIEWAIEQELSFYIFDRGRLESAKRAAERRNRQARLHLQIETGMNREGIEESDFETVTEFLKRNSGCLTIEGVCTHFSGAESIANWLRIDSQKQRFRKAVDHFKNHFPDIPSIHAASSAALLAYPECIFSMVRIGIAQYGFWPSRELFMLLQKEKKPEVTDPLQRVIKWRSKVMSLKKVEAGEFVGYGNMYMTGREEMIATVPIGYSHGFGRNLTNSGYVLINGSRAPVVGLVNMNMLTVDVTDIQGIQRGDEVVIIGSQGNMEISVASFGEMSNNLNYEVLTRLPDSIPRLVI